MCFGHGNEYDHQQQLLAYKEDLRDLARKRRVERAALGEIMNHNPRHLVGCAIRIARVALRGRKGR